jgi:hypothetical protein
MEQEMELQVQLTLVVLVVLVVGVVTMMELMVLVVQEQQIKDFLVEQILHKEVVVLVQVQHQELVV